MSRVCGCGNGWRVSAVSVAVARRHVIRRRTTQARSVNTDKTTRLRCSHSSPPALRVIHTYAARCCAARCCALLCVPASSDSCAMRCWAARCYAALLKRKKHVCERPFRALSSHWSTACGMPNKNLAQNDGYSRPERPFVILLRSRNCLQRL